MVDDVDSLTEDDLKSIAMEQMETAQETNETEKARWQNSRQTVQIKKNFFFVNTYFKIAHRLRHPGSNSKTKIPKFYKISNILGLLGLFFIKNLIWYKSRDTLPNNSYSFWADLVHRWLFQGYDYEYWPTF